VEIDPLEELSEDADPLSWLEEELRGVAPRRRTTA
jgi:hypothetical protein